jgi:pSer/pThr/pTyr-binding forkhead associated (FHA) protein/tetratricopeptide (TPR) repeat protein
MHTLVIRRTNGSETEHELTTEITIGRQQGSNSLVLAEGGISRRHARLWVDDGRVMLEDVGSANGTFVDGERITGAVFITPRSVVVLGDCSLRLKPPARTGTGTSQRQAPPTLSPSGPPKLSSVESLLEESAPPAAGAPRATRAMPQLQSKQPSAALARRSKGPAVEPGPASASPEAQTPVLKGLTGPWANQRFPLQGKMFVGRTPPAAVLLEDDSVSRKHAELEQTAEGVVLRDLGSANGTRVNGESVGTEPVVLQPGDTVQFGMVELAYETGGESDLVPVRRGGRELARPGRGEPAPAGSRSKLLGFATGLVFLVLAAAVVKVAVLDVPPPVTQVNVPPPPDPREKVAELLSQCRSYTSSEMGIEPDWKKAEAACSKALDLDPINQETLGLMRRIKLERESFEIYSQGEKALSRFKAEEALELYRKIPKESQYFRRAKPRVLEAVEEVIKRAADDCKRYAADGAWVAAVQRCGQYMGFACQKMSREELEPPLGYTLVLEKRRLRRNEWRPTNKLYLDFLIARKKLDPNADAWTCPKADIFYQDEAAPDPRKDVENAFKKNLTNKYLVEAMMDYWQGRGNESLSTLQKLRSDFAPAQVKYHAQADQLMKDAFSVDNLYKLGQSFLQKEEVEKAEEPFQEALEVDKRLMGELAETRSSFYRRSIQQEMADSSFRLGRYWDEREDQKRACRLWKLGFRFYTGNTDLNSAVGRCSSRAVKALNAAKNCAQLEAVLELAVPGDGIDEKVKLLKEENKC